MRIVKLRAEYSRRLPDPVLKNTVERHIFLCRAKDLPADIPLDPNPRNQNLNRAVYRDVEKSLLDQANSTFHLKNRGITAIAKEVRALKDSDSEFELIFDEGDGIVDGGHTYKIVTKNVDACPPTQYVRIEVLTGATPALIDDIAAGLNASLQVQKYSLADLSDKFDWIKEELKGAPYANKITYRENDDGAYNVRDIIAFMTLFNIKYYPNAGETHPLHAYGKKEACLDRFLDDDGKSFEPLKPLLRDILELHDYVQIKTQDLYNDGDKKYGALGIVEKRERGAFQFIFAQVDTTQKRRLCDGALLPILGAFRFLVADNGKGKWSWKPGSFQEVKNLYDVVAIELIKITRDAYDTHNRNPHAIGRDKGHWANLHRMVALRYLQEYELKKRPAKLAVH